MSDIATKLQSLSHWLRQLATHEPEPECKASHVECADDCVVAADEIHRLRMKVSGKDCEIARLREALAATFDALDRSSSPFPLSLEMTLAVLDHAKVALAQVAEVPE